MIVAVLEGVLESRRVRGRHTVIVAIVEGVPIAQDAHLQLS